MKRAWKVFWGLIAALAVLAILNAIVTSNETEPAQVTVEGAEILNLPGGDLQVLDLGPENEPAPGQPQPPPIVLIHGYTASINWWQDVIPTLSESHRVIAIDLLGHGGSAKPSSGYNIPGQADLIAQVLNELEVEGSVLVGHSLGGAVVTAVAEGSSELVDRLVIIGMAPDVENFGSLDLRSRISRLPVIGQAIKRVAPDPLLRNGLEQGFAPGFPVPDYAVEDLKRMTYTAYQEWPGANESFTAERPLNERVEASFIPLMVIFGSEDQIFDARESLSAFAAVPGARTELLERIGHSPQVEAPEETAALILEYAQPLPTAEVDEDEVEGEGRNGSGSARREGGQAGGGAQQGRGGGQGARQGGQGTGGQAGDGARQGGQARQTDQGDQNTGQQRGARQGQRNRDGSRQGGQSAGQRSTRPRAESRTEQPQGAGR